MAQRITRIYGNAEDAAAAVAELLEADYPRENITMLAPPAGVSEAEDGLVETISKLRILTARAKVLAGHVRAGGTLVTVRAEFGTAQGAINIMEAHNPIASGDPVVPKEAPSWDDGAPLSSSMNFAVILRNPTPVSSFWGMPVLTKRRSFAGGSLSSSKGTVIPMPTKSSSPYSLGVPGLMRSATPLSSAIGMKTLSKGRSFYK